MDIVDRLLALQHFDICYPTPHPTCSAAAAEITRLRKERDEARAAMAWQPIETAPKDGSEVLVYAALNPPEKWSEQVRDLPPYIGRGAYHEDAGWCVCTMREALYWMPLPTPEATK